MTYNKGGRILSQQEPNGSTTEYAYDDLNRRTTLTKPITVHPDFTSQTWSTAYTDLDNGKSQVTMTYPGTDEAEDYDVIREFDRLGRLSRIDYNQTNPSTPFTTPNIALSYDAAGNRTLMSENTGGVDDIRKTTYSYDALHRLASVAFDASGDGSVIETVSYEYDAGGLRTRLTMPGNLDVVYTYDQRGQLVSLTDWDSQKTQFAYDNVGRHIATERANGLRSRYQFDAAGRLKRLRYTKDFRTLAHFDYQVDKRGNRTQAQETLANIATATNTTIAATDKGLVLSGTWSDGGSYKESTQSSARLKLLFFGDEATLSMGQGPDHALYDVYINNTLWQSFDGYASSASQRDIVLTTDIDGRKLQGEGPHLLEIRNRTEKNKNSSGYKVRFKQLTVADLTWTQQTIVYKYDYLSRLKEARYNPGVNTAAIDDDLLRHYLYAYDRAGNRKMQSVAINGGSPTVTNYNYNAANQLISDGTNTLTYDNNGNLTSDGVNSYTWDRANRLLTWNNGVAADLVNHAYDGEGRRVSQAVGTTSPTITKYLLDIQPGLAVVLSQTEGSDVTRFVHAPRGIHARQDASNDWHWTVQDGLGTVRVETDNSVGVEGSQNLDPFGNLIGSVNGTIGTPYGFTGELVDGSGLLDLRARRYNAGIGVFASLDPFEGKTCTPMSLNGYSWVEGNVPNAIDPSGMIYETPDIYAGCVSSISSAILLSILSIFRGRVGGGFGIFASAGAGGFQTDSSQNCGVELQNRLGRAPSLRELIAAGCITSTPQFPPLVTNTPQPTNPPTLPPFATNTPQPTNTPPPPTSTPSPIPLVIPRATVQLSSVFGSSNAIPLPGAGTALYGQGHYAVDIVPEGGGSDVTGTPVYAVCTGQVIHKGNNTRPYYNSIVEQYCDHDDNTNGTRIVIYSHVCALSTLKNRAVAGEQLGTIAGLAGGGGDCQDDGSIFPYYGATHLHFQTKAGSNDNPPSQYLKECQSQNPPSWCIDASTP